MLNIVPGGGRKAKENQQCCIPGKKVLGKMSSIPGDQVWKQYPGRSVSFGQQPGGTRAWSKAHGLENTVAILFQAFWRYTGAVLQGNEPQQHNVKHYLPCNVCTEWKPPLTLPAPLQRCLPWLCCTKVNAWTALGKAKQGPQAAQ